jgi:hypothetical protein
MDPTSTEPTSIREPGNERGGDGDVIADARVKQLRRLVLSRLLAVALAAEVDWHELMDLLGRGVRPTSPSRSSAERQRRGIDRKGRCCRVLRDGRYV